MSSLAGADVQALLAEVAGRAGRYLASLDERPVAPDGAAVAGLARFDEPLPERPGDAAKTLALLDEAGSPATMASAGGRYFGFVTGGSHPAALAAGWLATAWDQNAALPVMSPAAARLHEVATRWLGEVNTGAFDPFPAVLEWARRRRAWVHVDGAFGLWALADPSRSHLAAGLAGADSWATDAHKWLNVPYDCGLALVRRPEDLAGVSPRWQATCPPMPASRPCTTRRRPRSAPGRSRCGRSCARWAGRA